MSVEIEGDVVRLRRTTPLDMAFTQALEDSLTEWSSKEDDKAFLSL